MRNSVLLGALLLLSIGCFDKEVFTKIEDKTIVGNTPATVKIVNDNYGVIDIKSSPDADIEIRTQKIGASCSTERARSIGSDFDGYILIEVYRSGKFAAKAQMDFKTEPVKRDYKKVWAKLKEKLNWN